MMQGIKQIGDPFNPCRRIIIPNEETLLERSCYALSEYNIYRNIVSVNLKEMEHDKSCTKRKAVY